jgi:predicted dehydrogenase
MKALRFGILSTAGIGRKNWKALFHSGNCVVTGVASRDIEKSRKYIEECQQAFTFVPTPQAFGSYEALISSPTVDAIYIPLPTALRFEWVERAAIAGKHVICEKPCAVNAVQLEEMLHLCRKYRVQFMDGVMFMHNPRLPKMRQFLDDGVSVGPLRRINSSFSFYVNEDFFLHNIRANGELEPTGCLGDLGWYSIRYTLWALQWQMPLEASGRILAQSQAINGRTSAPTEFTAELTFAEGITAGFYCSFHAARQQWMIVAGQKGYLSLPDFVRPLDSYAPSFSVNDRVVRVEGPESCPPGVDPMLQGHPQAQDTFMFRNFAQQVASGKLEENWPEWSMKTQLVMDACLQSAQLGKPVKL